MANSGGWAALPADLLRSVADRVVPFSDCVRFSLVCKSWNCVVVECLLGRQKAGILHHQQLPLLLVPSKDNSDHKRSLYSVLEDKVYDFQLSVPYGKRFCGSCHGWLIGVEETMAVSLMNPFSGAAITLPPVKDTWMGQDWMENWMEVSSDDEVPYDGHYGRDVRYDRGEEYHNDEFVEENVEYGFGRLEDFNPEGEEEADKINRDRIDCDFAYRINCHYTIHKAVLSRDPALYPDDYAVMVIYGEMNRLAFIKSGDKSWTFLGERLKLFKDIIFYQGKFHILHYWGKLMTLDVNESPPRLDKIVPSFIPFSPSLKGYIVELPRTGDLAWIYVDYISKEFQVLKLEIDQTSRTDRYVWVKTGSLGDDVSVFFGDSYSTSVSASDFTGCRPDCIYFTDNSRGVPYRTRVGPCDNGFYSLEDRAFGKHYIDPNSQPYPLPPTWILPQFMTPA